MSNPFKQSSKDADRAAQDSQFDLATVVAVNDEQRVIAVQQRASTDTPPYPVVVPDDTVIPPRGSLVIVGRVSGDKDVLLGTANVPDDADTSLLGPSVSDDGTEILPAPKDLNFSDNTTVTDDGDDTVTITATAGGGAGGALSGFWSRDDVNPQVESIITPDENATYEPGFDGTHFYMNQTYDFDNDDTAESVLTVFDVGEPANPNQVAEIDIGIAWDGVEVANDMLIAVSGTDMVIVDVTDPAAPTVSYSGTIGSLNGLVSVTISDSYCYVGEGDSDTFSVINVSDPTAPSVVKTIDLDAINTHNAQFLSSYDNFLYLRADAETKAETVTFVWDIAAPETPRPIGATGLTQALATATAKQTIYDNGIAIAAFGGPSRYAIFTADLETPADDATAVGTTFGKLSVDSFSLERTLNLGYIPEDAIVADGDYMYVGDADESTVRVYDVSDPGEPSQTALISKDVVGMDIRGSYLYLACATEIAIVDITDPENPSIAGTVADSWADITAYNDSTAVVVKDTSIATYDISDKATPTLDKEIQGYSTGGLQDVTTDGETVYAGGESLNGTPRETFAISVADTGEPRFIGPQTPPPIAFVNLRAEQWYDHDRGLKYYVDSDLNHVYIDNLSLSIETADAQPGDGGGGGTTVSVSDDGTEILSSPEDLNFADALEVVPDGDNTVTINGLGGGGGGSESGVVSREEINPTLKSHIVPNGTTMQETAFDGTTAYIYDRYDKDGDGSDEFYVRVVDLSNPTNPTQLAEIDLGADAFVTAMDVHNGVLFVTRGFASTPKLWIYDVSDPANPELDYSGGLNSLENFRSIVIDGEYAYLGEMRDDSIVVIDISDTTNPSVVDRVYTSRVDVSSPNYTAVYDGFLYHRSVSVNNDEVTAFVWDISDPTNVHPIGSTGMSTALAIATSDATSYQDGLLIHGYADDTEDKYAVVKADLPTLADDAASGTGVGGGNEITETIDYGSIENKSVFTNMTTPQTLEITDNYVYFVDNSGATLEQLDITDGAVSTVTLNEFDDFWSITQAGNRLYVSGFDGTNDIFGIIDISDHANPDTVSTASAKKAYDCLAADKKQTHVYAIDEPDLETFDVSDEQNVTSTQALLHGPDWSQITISEENDTVAYISTDDHHVNESVPIHAMDVSDPANPSIITDDAHASFTEGISLYNFSAYDEAGETIAVANLNEEQIVVGDYDEPTSTQSFGGSGGSGLTEQIDYGNLTNTSTTSVTAPRTLAVTDGYVYYVDDDNFALKQLERSSGTITDVTPSGLSNVTGIDQINDRIYAGGDDGTNDLFAIIDISDHTNVSLVSTTTAAWVYTAVAVDSTQTYAYGVDGRDFQKFDISDEQNITSTYSTVRPYISQVAVSEQNNQVVYISTDHITKDPAGPIYAVDASDLSNLVVIEEGAQLSFTERVKLYHQTSYNQQSNTLAFGNFYSDSIVVGDYDGPTSIAQTGSDTNDVTAGSITLSSGVATVDTGVATSETATFAVYLGPDTADADVAADVRADSGTGTYVVDIQETDTSVGNPTVNYDVVRRR